MSSSKPTAGTKVKNLFMVPGIRIAKCNEKAVNPDGSYVIYWMTTQRRTHWNFALQRAVEWVAELRRPLLVFEALRCGYKWANDRIHKLIIDGMRDNEVDLSKRGVHYFPYLELRRDQGKGLLEQLAKSACVVVTDHFPCFFVPRMLEAAAGAVTVLMEKVDSNGLLPISSTPKAFSTAAAFRRHLAKSPLLALDAFPEPDPLNTLMRLEVSPDFSLPSEIGDRWPKADLNQVSNCMNLFEIDHGVSLTEDIGGTGEAASILDKFLDEKIVDYAENRNHPDKNVTSGLSAFLHFGHISAHEIAAQTVNRGLIKTGFGGPLGAELLQSRNEGVGAFLDQLITWRELGFNFCEHRRDYDVFDSLPPWAVKTLEDHRHDQRPYTYSLDELENARTADKLWNAAQKQLLLDGVIHNYMRMLWGKKILEWSPDPRTALDTMIHLNNKYALDGRDPNSYSGIFWVLGRYDRPWPERPIFGKIRYMSSLNTARKLKLKNYVSKFS